VVRLFESSQLEDAKKGKEEDGGRHVEPEFGLIGDDAHEPSHDKRSPNEAGDINDHQEEAGR